eukprot:TRINITY_DN85136_c0_g1_i1.p1 TRINITY_DN85136_c0_g1~~TRINITY_DN85136_c0_g1_i1.p1  ORF type:complete len:282 (+),score=21.65 TRINITY_DN85136_c0_g1_i1:34-879(+)
MSCHDDADELADDFADIAWEFEDDITEVLPKQLFISDVLVAEKEELLQSTGITHILNCAAQSQCFFPDNFEYKHLYDLIDFPDQDITLYFEETTEYITRTIQSGGCILVHCMAGRSRAPAIVLYYLMVTNEWSFAKAWAFLSELRPGILPNKGFLKGILHFYYTGQHLPSLEEDDGTSGSSSNPAPAQQFIRGNVDAVVEDLHYCINLLFTKSLEEIRHSFNICNQVVEATFQSVIDKHIQVTVNDWLRTYCPPPAPGEILDDPAPLLPPDDTPEPATAPQ